jgi:CRISPR system Cascade subunit CasA
MNHHFNLLYEPWIWVEGLDGRSYRVSLSELLLNAGNYRAVSAGLPHTNASVMRLLLAVLHRNFGPRTPEDWKEIWEHGAFDAFVLEQYFEQVFPAFDLFSETRPFYQCRHPLMEAKPAQTLLQIIGGGDTFTLFDHVMDDTPFSLTPADAALMLITAQAFGLAGLCHPQLKLVYTDAPCSRAAVFFVEGKTLFETLMFNLVRYNRATPFSWLGPDDPPAWERDDPYLPERTRPQGYLDYLTWQNRKIMLIPSEQNGQTVVNQVVLAPGLSLSAELHNPMHHYSIDRKKKGGDEKFKVLRITEGRALWRDSYALLHEDKDVDAPFAIQWMSHLVNEGILPPRRLQLAAYGMSTEPGKQKVNFYRGDRFQIDDDLLRKPELVEKLGSALQHAEALRKELWFALLELAKLTITFTSDRDDGRKPDPKDVQKLIDHWNAEGLYWSRLENGFTHFLDRLPEDPEAALQDWNQGLRTAALDAFHQTAAGLGDGLNAMKATAEAQRRLYSGIRYVLGPRPEEE